MTLEVTPECATLSGYWLIKLLLMHVAALSTVSFNFVCTLFAIILETCIYVCIIL